MKSLCFFAERQVGLGSVADAVRRVAERQPGLRLTWVDVTYQSPGHLVARLPLLPRSLRGPLHGFLQTGTGLRRGPYDALIFMTHNPAVFRQGAMRRTPTLLWTDVTPVQYDALAGEYGQPVTRFRAVAAFKRAMVTRTFRVASRCLAWSEWARRSFVADYGIPPERTGVVRPGIDLQLWQSPPRDARHGPRPFRLLFVGGDFRRKGGALLLKVFREHLRSSCELHVVTREDVADEAGVRVHRGLASNSPELRRLYHDADAFVLPTLADTFGIACVEAMATGLPVISTRTAALPEIVAEGRSGFLVPPGDWRSLGQAVEALAADRVRAHAMGLRGREIAERLFDARLSVPHLLDQALRVGML